MNLLSYSWKNDDEFFISGEKKTNEFFIFFASAPYITFLINHSVGNTIWTLRLARLVSNAFLYTTVTDCGFAF